LFIIISAHHPWEWYRKCWMAVILMHVLMSCLCVCLHR